MNLNKLTIGFVLLFSLIAVAVGAQTPRINIQVKGLYPEGTVFNPKNNLFYVSSVADGTVGTVDLQGNYKQFYVDKSLKSTYGMKIDPLKNRLWVCVSDGNYSKFSEPSTFKKTGRLLALDLSSGKKVADINLAALYNGKHFLNDLVLDKEGNIYVTDSYAPVIYKVDAQGKASVFAKNDFFKGEGVGLNGIAYHPQGFLLVTNNSSGTVYKVNVNKPQEVTKVEIDQFFPGSDGLIVTDANTLVLVQNKGVEKVFKLESTDNWKSAKVIAATAATDRFQHPSTGTVMKDKIYVLNSKLNELSDKTKRPSPAFSLQLVQFRPVP